MPFGEAQSELHKWHSNEPELEASSEPEDGKQNYAKEQLGVEPWKTKMLGLPGNKIKCTIAFTFWEASPEVSTREMLPFHASVFDPLSLASPVSLVGKLLYREVCDKHLPWDQKVPNTVVKQWKKFERSLPDQVHAPCSLPGFKEATEVIDLHVFRDTIMCSGQLSFWCQPRFTGRKLMPGKKGLTIPKLKLVSPCMKITEDVKNALEGQPAR